MVRYSKSSGEAVINTIESLEPSQKRNYSFSGYHGWSDVFICKSFCRELDGQLMQA